jgi:hypothetical protein
MSSWTALRHAACVGWAAGVGACLVAVSSCNDLPVAPADVPNMQVRGITLADWTADGYSLPAADVAVDRIAQTGANVLTIIVTAYQANVRSSAVRVDAQRTPTTQSVAQVILKARSIGGQLAIAIKPHVDVDTGEWRGRIAPADAEAWFDSYGSFIATWADFAQSMGVEQFVVGTELAGTVQEDARWRALIDDVRARYAGEILYAASWDEAGKVPFWDRVDVVGVNFYGPVAVRADAGRFEFLKGWQPWLDRLRLLHKQAGRDIIISEIGYRSIDGAGMHPYDFDRAARSDVSEQADLYWAALQALGDKPWIRGVYWWNWLVSSGADAAFDYTPEGKPAEQELIDAWRP